MRRNYWISSTGKITFGNRTYRHYTNWRGKYGYGKLDTRNLRVKFLRWRARTLKRYKSVRRANMLHR